MEEDPAMNKKTKGDRRRSSELESARDEIKKFKENLLQSVATGDSIIAEREEMAIPQPFRSRSASRARDALCIPPNILAQLDENKAPNPLDFDGFVNLLGFKTLELDSEETLVAALSRIRHDLMTWGDRFTDKEADYALDDAPVVVKDGNTMIDYVRFCSQLCGLKKQNNA
ncbi:Myosin regulatory light chain 10 [Operophtera brumata]|uniref:Myosin regulatory light chain 10 n=1 Tax=Operophtera brumata TaxID=104452 RepID=A0A0L7LEQ8_OPEBR|nr:Myosin regulatory light chain 10 [Operophtera brumata]